MCDVKNIDDPLDILTCKWYCVVVDKDSMKTKSVNLAKQFDISYCFMPLNLSSCGELYAMVRADSEEEAIEKAMEQFKKKGWVE